MSNKTIYTSKSTRDGRVVRLVPIEDVSHITYSLKCATLVLRDGKEVHVDRSLKNLMEEFPEFTQVHRNLIIRLDEVACAAQDGNTFYVQLQDNDTKLEVSRRCSAIVKKHMRERS